MVLLVGAEGVVDVPLQVDGQVRNPEQRSGHVNHPVNQLTVTLQDDKTHTHTYRKSPGGKRLNNFILVYVNM